MSDDIQMCGQMRKFYNYFEFVCVCFDSDKKGKQ